MKILEIEQINRFLEQNGSLTHTARAGATLASLIRGAIRGCDANTDPDGRLEKMLSGFLEYAGFEGPKGDEPAKRIRKRCPRCNQRCILINGILEAHMEPPSPYGHATKLCDGAAQTSKVSQNAGSRRRKKP